MEGDKHKKLFRRWQKRVQPRTRFLSEEIERILLPDLNERGFVWVDYPSISDGEIERSNAICLENRKCAPLRAIHIFFSEHDAARFGMTLGIYSAEEKQYLDIAQLVRWKTHDWKAKEWGLRWYSLNRSNNRLTDTVEETRSLLPQVDAFFERGERGPNITDELPPQPPPPANLHAVKPT